jgi:sugar-specific transcriptional regulator TrmB
VTDYLTKAEQKVIHTLRQNGKLSALEVKGLSGVHHVYVLKILKKLIDSGVVARQDPIPPMYSFIEKE